MARLIAIALSSVITAITSCLKHKGQAGKKQL
jgi:hypothetical protein